MPRFLRPRAAAALACALAGASLSLAACHPRVPAPALEAGPQALLADVQRAQAAVQRVQGEARVHLASPQGSGSLRQFVAAERPDRLHLETLDFFGNVSVVLVAAGGRFALYDGREKIFYRGAATPENLARLVPVPLPAEDLVTILCGSAPLHGRPVSAEPVSGGVALTLDEDGAVTRAKVGAQALVEEAERRVGGGVGPGSWTVGFSLHRAYGAAFLPGKIALASAPAHVQLELLWSEVEVNGELSPALFRLEPPRGAKVVDLSPGDPLPDALFRPQEGPPAPERPQGPGAP